MVGAKVIIRNYKKIKKISIYKPKKERRHI